MHQLVKTVLAVRSWLAENNWSCMNTLVQSNTSGRTGFPITIHVKLLDVSWEPEQGLAVWQDSSGLYSANVRIVKADQAHHRNSIGSQRSIEL